MGCCDKNKSAVVSIATKAKHIVQGNVRALLGVKYEFTDDRIRVCQACKLRYEIVRSLWCSICKCFVPAKARVEAEDCPKGKWPARKSSQKENTLSDEKK